MWGIRQLHLWGSSRTCNNVIIYFWFLIVSAFVNYVTLLGFTIKSADQQLQWAVADGWGLTIIFNVLDRHASIIWQHFKPANTTKMSSPMVASMFFFVHGSILPQLRFWRHWSLRSSRGSACIYFLLPATRWCIGVVLEFFENRM